MRLNRGAVHLEAVHRVATALQTAKQQVLDRMFMAAQRRGLHQLLGKAHLLSETVFDSLKDAGFQIRIEGHVVSFRGVKASLR